MIKVYQLRKDLNSFEILLPYKGAKVKVTFKDGNTYKGIRPRLYTNDKFRQKVLESSHLYKEGVIVLERTIKEAGDDEAADTQQSTRGGNTSHAEPGVTVETKKIVGSGEEQSLSDDEAAVSGEKLEFANLAEAIVYVAQQYGQQVQTANEVRKVLQEHGQKAVIHK